MARISLNKKALSKMSDKELQKRFNAKTTPTLDYILHQLNREIERKKESKR